MDRDTVLVYETRAAEWRDRRPARFVERARALADAAAPGSVRLDLGCGPGLHLPSLGLPVVALDAAFSMVDLAREVVPDAWPLQADLMALPFRDQCAGGAWARASYLHIARPWLPWALAELHDALAVGAPVDLTMRHSDDEGLLPEDDFAGRYFVGWRAGPLRDVLVGAGFTVDELAAEPARGEWLHVRATRRRTLADRVGPDLTVLLVGLNPSEYAADAGVGFARPGNRFWPAALASGLVSRDRDPRDALRSHGVGMTDLVKRATPSASALRPGEYRDGVARVERLVSWLRPRVVCFVGLTGWRAAVDRTATAGPQPGSFAGVPVYVMPNTSGANAHTRPDDFVAHLAAVRRLAGA
ncbi:MAG TPA: uracil-DNA glycosylase family protein [Acidimicrobiia bacterium]|nr:uracil-DNA glycosylase family protein [Acidimicrobiia bacterium]